MRLRLRAMGLFLVLGAIANVAVAWGLSIDRGIYNEVESMPGMFPPHGTLDWEARRFWGGVLHRKPGRYGAEVIISFELDDMIEREGMSTDEDVLARLEMMRAAGVRDLPSWSGVRSFRSMAAERLEERLDRGFTDRAFGWPMLSLAWHARGRLDGDAAMWRREVTWGIPLASTDTPLPQMMAPGMFPWLGLENPWVLPLRPIWSGFFTNTLFYALLLWLFFATPFAVRRNLRRRRGLCGKCAYPIGGAPVCTECGAQITVRNSARNTYT